MGREKLRLWKNFPKISKGGTIFYSLQGGKFHFPQPVLDKFWKNFFGILKRGGGRTGKVAQKSKRGWKRLLWTGVQMGEENFLGIFKGGEKFFS